MEKKPKITGVPLGGPSLLMAFILLCLTTFAVISYLSALRDFRLSDKTAENVAMYYEADGLGEEILAKVHGMVKDQIPFQDMKRKIFDVEISLEEKENAFLVVYDVPIQEELVIHVKAEVTPKPDGVHVLSWKMENTGEYEDGMDIFDLPVLQ